jgi:hypothetical protein
MARRSYRVLLNAHRSRQGVSASALIGAHDLRAARRTVHAGLCVRPQPRRLVSVAQPASARSIQHAAYNTQHTTRSIQHAAYNTQHTTCSIQHAAYNTQHTTRSIQHAAYNMQHTMRSIQCAAYNTQHTMFSIRRATRNICCNHSSQWRNRLCTRRCNALP